MAARDSTRIPSAQPFPRLHKGDLVISLHEMVERCCILPAKPTQLTDLQATTAYTLGRFLALAEMAGDPLYRLAPEEIIQRMKEVAHDYETVKKGEI
jgi:hypothetical protein